MIGLQMFDERAFFKHQRIYLSKVVRDVWHKSQQKVIAISKRNPNLKLAGDARCDSMGHRYSIFMSVSSVLKLV